jgi:membrane-bound ClpP family serine protease
MCGLAVLLAVPAFGSLMAGSVSAATGADDLDPVDVVEVSGLFDRIVADNIETAIDRAQSNGSQAVILQLNSKGAVISRDEMAGVMEVMRSSARPVVGSGRCDSDGTRSARRSHRNFVDGEQRGHLVRVEAGR